jgi:hypothetical protein
MSFAAASDHPFSYDRHWLRFVPGVCAAMEHFSVSSSLATFCAGFDWLRFARPASVDAESTGDFRSALGRSRLRGSALIARRRWWFTTILASRSRKRKAHDRTVQKAASSARATRPIHQSVLRDADLRRAKRKLDSLDIPENRTKTICIPAGLP